MDDLTREFLIESQEGLDRMERCLTDLEAKPGDSAILSEIFRSVHTIKGTTGFLGFKHLEKLAHTGENLLGLLREKKLQADASIVTALLRLLDALRLILKSIECDGTEGNSDHEMLIRLLEDLQEPRKTGERRARVTKITRSKRKVGHAIEGQTSIAQVATVGLKEEIAQRRPNEKTQPPTSNEATEPAPTRSVPSVPSTAESTLRVDVALLNRLMNLVGELVLTRNQILQAASAHPNMTLLSRRLDMVTADLRESVMKARMQPVSHVFSKIPRLVRDLAQSLHRQVRLEIEGQETELDKSLLEAIKDPLTHAVRNALDHGVEPPEVRAEAGKSPEGLLRLRAYQEGSHVIIEVSDDGAGIECDRIRAKAVEKGLITQSQVSQLSERDLLQMIFLPGFSTAKSVTNVSGRGVGMDVVRTNVERIGGKVEIDSRLGKGTTLRLRIPLTLAIIPALIVKSRNQSFALPQSALSELVHVSNEPSSNAVEWIDNAPLYRLRGKFLPLAYLSEMLCASTTCPAADGNTGGFIAVLNADGREFGLVVDDLADPEEIVVKPLSSALKGIGIYSGATVLGNGGLSLILDPGAIASRVGVTSIASDGELLGGAESDEGSSASMEFLLVEIGGRKAAIPLADVLRIEQVPIGRFEMADRRTILNLDGALLPIDDSADTLALNERGAEAQAIVVVCRVGDSQKGFVVTRVLDVASGSDLFEAGSARPASGVTLLKNQVTEIIALRCDEPLPNLPTTYTEQLPKFSEMTQ